MLFQEEFIFLQLRSGLVGQEDPKDQVGNLKTHRWKRILPFLRPKAAVRKWPERTLSQPEHFLPSPETGTEESTGGRAVACSSVQTPVSIIALWNILNAVKM